MEIREILNDEKENSSKLEAITNGYSKTNSFLKKAVWFAPAVYVVGVMPHEAQKWFCDKTGYGTPKFWTSLNAYLIGLAGVGAECFFLLKAGDDGGFIKDFSEHLNVAYNAGVYAYGLSFGLLQSLIRLDYTHKTGRGAWAFGLVPTIINSPHIIKWVAKKVKNMSKVNK